MRRHKRRRADHHPKRVLLVGSSMHYTSGISYYTYYLGKELATKCDLQVVLMRSLVPKRLYPGRDHVDVTISPLSLGDVAPTFDGIDWWNPWSMYGAAARVWAAEPDLVILQWWTGAVLHWYIILAAVGRLRGADILIEFHEIHDSGEARIPLVSPLVHRGLRLLTRLASRFVVHSEFDRGELSAVLEMDATQIEVIAHGPYQLSPAPARPEPDAGGRSPSEHQILFFGTIRPYKGLEVLVSAFEALAGRDPGRWRLKIVGESWENWTEPLERVSRSEVRDHIEVTNRYVADAEVPGIFATADVVALPYLRSSASGPLHIAMSYGLPVVVSSVGGLTEIAQRYAGAFFATPGDASSLEAGIREAVRHPGPHPDPVSWEDSVTALLGDEATAVTVDGTRAR